ncbi:VWA domain-containing protein [Candidatus Magnetobacterium casense]|uniref:VWA domain-containing protein n=1 Tax=Candidatus Magnetobacterium casense TaxID=1455061 RepID=UPI000590B940|nr:VWA domain-containing protein [Candidatus Magnetobacterium casensis]
MKRIFLVICIALVSLSLAGGQEQDNVSLDIAALGANSSGTLQTVIDVHDQRGKSIQGLKPGNFTLTVGDKKAKGSALQKKYEDPLSVIIAVDVSGSMSGVALSDTKKYLFNLIHQLNDDNHIMLITFGGEIRDVVHFTQNRELLYSQIDNLKAVEKKTILYQAVTDGIKKASRAPTSKTAILLITDGRDEHSHLNEQDVLNTVESSYIPLYTITLGKHKHTDAIKKLSDISGGYFLLSPNHNEIVQLGRIISDIVDSRYIVDFDLTLPPGKYTGVVGFNHMGKELTAQKEFTVSTAPATATMTTPKVEHIPVERTLQVTQSNWSDNRLIVILFMLLGLSAFCNILLALWALRRPKESATTNAAVTTIDDINRKIDAITSKVSEPRPEVPFEEIVYKLNDAGSRITALTAELRNLPTEDVSPLIGRLERELAKMASVTGMVSDRMEAMDAGIKGIAKELVKTNDKLPTIVIPSQERLEQGIKALSKEVATLRDDLSADKYGDSFEKLSNRLDGIEAAITEISDSAWQDTQNTKDAISELLQVYNIPDDLLKCQDKDKPLGDITKEIAKLKDYFPFNYDIGSKIDALAGSLEEITDRLTDRLDDIEMVIAHTNDTAQQKTGDAIKGLSQLIQTPPDLTSAYAPMIQKVESALADIAGEIAQLKDKPAANNDTDRKIDAFAASFKAIAGRLDEIETFIAKTNDAAQQKTETGFKDLSRLIQTSPDWILTYASTVQELEAGLRDIAGEVRHLRDKSPAENGVDSSNLDSKISSLGASFKLISGRLDELETFISKTNKILKQQTQDGLNGLSTAFGSSLNTSMSAILAAVQGRLQELETSIATIAKDLASLRDNPPVTWPDNIKGSFDALSNRLDEIEGFIAKTNNTMRQRSDERLLEFTQTLQTSIDTSVSERMAEGIRNLNDELVALREKLSDMPMDKSAMETRSSIDKVQSSLTEKLETAIRGLYDELAQLKGKLPDMAIVSELGVKLEQLSQQSREAFSGTVDTLNEKTTVLFHDLGGSLQTIGSTIDGIEDIIRKVSYNLSDDNSGSVKAQILTVRETMSDIIRFLLVLSDNLSENNSGSIKEQIMAVRETMSDIIRFLLVLSDNLSENNSDSIKEQIMALRETMSDIIRFLLLLSER